ncbi:MAG: hypothetical protein IT538_14320 [Variibacter sp.]|nr:hypothetical protein [Variibacter sp.]
MLDLSLAGLLGAIVGIVMAALAYGPLLASSERWMRRRCEQGSAEERASLAQELPLLRRAVLALDILIFTGAGYWLGAQLGG